MCRCIEQDEGHRAVHDVSLRVMERQLSSLAFVCLRAKSANPCAEQIINSMEQDQLIPVNNNILS